MLDDIYYYDPDSESHRPPLPNSLRTSTTSATRRSASWRFSAMPRVSPNSAR